MCNCGWGERDKEKESEVCMDLKFEGNRNWYCEGVELIDRFVSDEIEVRLFVCGIIRGLIDCGYSEKLFNIMKGEIEFNKLFNGKGDKL